MTLSPLQPKEDIEIEMSTLNFVANALDLVFSNVNSQNLGLEKRVGQETKLAVVVKRTIG